MVLNSPIEWTETTWNPVTGCTKISQGCKHCYAEVMARRLQAMGVRRYNSGFAVKLQPDLLEAPLKWKRPRLVFVNSMSDLFHESVPVDFIRKVFVTMKVAKQHTFQVLTKRSGRLREISESLEWPRNVWMGVSVENEDATFRVADLQGVRAGVRFLSLEPLLGPIGALPLDGIQWVIVGGESGPRARPIQAEWVRSVLHQCRRAGVPFFFKQWGGTRKHATGRVLDGSTYGEMPNDSSHGFAAD